MILLERVVSRNAVVFGVRFSQLKKVPNTV